VRFDDTECGTTPVTIPSSITASTA
jgi:hypothetical protein